MAAAVIRSHATGPNVGGSSTMPVAPGGTITTGDWMIAVLSWQQTAGAVHTAPATGSWTQLGSTTYSGTLCSSVWVGTRGSGDSSYNFTSNLSGWGRWAIIYGTGGKPKTDWVTSSATRAAGGTTTTTVAPAIAAQSNDCLVISIATERTSAAETDVTSVTNTTKLFFSPALNSTQIETICVGTKTVTAGNSITAVTFTYPNVQATNGWAMSIAIPEAPPENPGLEIDYVNDVGTLSTGKLFWVDGSEDLHTPKEIRQLPQGYASVTAMLAGASTSTPFYVAHRGGSLNWPEMSLHAYTQSAWHGAGALELSLARTSDGVWFGLHDEALDRTSDGTGGGSGTNKVASAMTWSQVQANTINSGPGSSKPYMRLEQYLESYANSHVTFVDIKYATAYASELIGILGSSVDDSDERFIYKAFGVGGATPAGLFRTAGYKTWGYFYQASAGNIAAEHSKWDIIGMDYSADSTSWTQANAPGKPVMGHIVPNPAAASTSLSRNAVGLMVSGVTAVVPRAN